MEVSETAFSAGSYPTQHEVAEVMAQLRAGWLRPYRSYHGSLGRQQVAGAYQESAVADAGDHVIPPVVEDRQTAWDALMEQCDRERDERLRNEFPTIFKNAR